MSQNPGVGKELQVKTPTTPEWSGCGGCRRPRSATSGEKEVWTCARVVDERKQIICGEQAVDEVLVRNDAGLFCVALCEFHKREHYEFYRRRRTARFQNKVKANTAGPFRTKGAPFKEPDSLEGEVLDRGGRVLASISGAVN